LFGQLLKPCFLTGFDLSKARPELMANWEEGWASFHASDLLSAATTFPGVFDPVLLKGPGPQRPFLTDMGMVENDPSLAILQVVRQLAPEARVVLVDLGTGRYFPEPNPYELTHWGALRWLTEMLPSISSGNVQVTERNMQAEEAYIGKERLAYYDIEIDLPQGEFYHPFNGSAQNLANVRALAEKCVQTNRAKLDALARELVPADDSSKHPSLSARN